jgi:beta-1,4-mannosyltransferase
MSPRERPVVLMSTRRPTPEDNPYLRELVEQVSADADVRFLSARTALFSRPDVFHVHWPHQLYRAASRPKALVKALLSRMLLARLRRRGTPVVLTVHNRASHEPENARERRMLRTLDRAVTLRILLNEDAGNPPDGVVVLHPDYRRWLAGLDIDVAALERATPVTRDVLLFGMLRPYKGIESLLSAAPAAPATLTIAGPATDPDYVQRLQAQAPASVAFDVRRLDDAELVRAILAHRLVCLPYPDLYNSGALLYALSVGRPVVVPRTGATAALAAEVGPGWLSLYDGALSAGVVATALARAREKRPPVDLSRRDSTHAARLHVALYRALAALPAGAAPEAARAAVLADPAFAAHSPRNR